jgi:hypothetical protein
MASSTPLRKKPGVAMPREVYYYHDDNSECNTSIAFLRAYDVNNTTIVVFSYCCLNKEIFV